VTSKWFEAPFTTGFDLFFQAWSLDPPLRGPVLGGLPHVTPIFTQQLGKGCIGEKRIEKQQENHEFSL
jgi:hypothetical protein